ncbi:MAG: nucleotidyltransferase family protein [Phycisphaerae bacterium]
MVTTLPQLAFDPQALRDVCRRCGIRRLWVFGSAARSDLREDSDIDVAVEYVPGQKPDLFEFVGHQDELANVLGHKLDLATLESIRPVVLRRIEPDLRLIYEADDDAS